MATVNTRLHAERRLGQFLRGHDATETGRADRPVSVVGFVMCSAISLFWSAIWPFVFGAFGCFVANFFARPFLDFLVLRSEVHEEIIFTGNVGPMTADKPDYVVAVDSLRRLGAKMQAMDVRVRTPLAQVPLLSLAQAPLRRFLPALGFDLATAGRDLIGLSNALLAVGRPFHVDRIEVAMKLPRSSTDDYLQALHEQIRKGPGGG